MFTDMVGYTALGQKDESLSLALVEETKKPLRPIFVRHNGKEVKMMGDAFSDSDLRHGRSSILGRSRGGP